MPAVARKSRLLPETASDYRRRTQRTGLGDTATRLEACL